MRKKFKWTFSPQIVKYLVCVCTLCLFCVVPITSFASSQKVTVKQSNVPIENVLREIEKQCNYTFFYSDNSVVLNKRVSIDMHNAPLESVLNAIFKDSGYSYKISGKQIIINRKQTVSREKVSNVQQDKKQKISGVVKDATGEPVIGASVFVKGMTTLATATDVNGHFTLDVPEGSTVMVSFIGYKTSDFNVTRGNSTYNITMSEDTKTLQEVVVVGFGTQKKINVTGAVSTVDAKELAARPVNSTIDALQGVVPGMNITTGSYGGGLDGTKSFNIRGVGTIGAGSSVTPLVLIDGMEGDMNALNPQDIENISVLKDAASSSIYGSRAPGGVILITTKKGKTGKPSVNYNNSFRFVSPLNMPEMADSYSFAVSINDQLQNGGSAAMYSSTKLQQILDYQAGKRDASGNRVQYMWPTSAGRWNSFDDPDRKDVMPAGNTDWLKTLFGNSFTQEHTLSLTGGSDQIQYYLSANYLNQGGLLKYGNDNKQRYSFTAKIDAQLAKWLRVGYNMRFGRIDYDSPSFSQSNAWNVFYFDVCRYWPVIPSVDPNGFYTQESKIYQLTQGGRYKTTSDVLSQQLNFLLEPIKNWKTHIELNYRTNYNFNHKDNQTVYGYDVNKNPYIIANETSGVSEYSYKSNFFNTNIYTEYLKEFAGGHTLKGMVGFQSELLKDRSINASKEGIMSGVATLNTTQTNAQASGGYGDWATVGFFGRLNYNYQERYLLEANLRYDGTSRFLRNNRWNWFPSFSIGWNVAREKFFENMTDMFSNLKVRASWGELGNQNTDNWYPFYRTISLGQANGSWLVGGLQPNTSQESALVSSLLTWEKTQTLNLGLDVTMLNNRLNVNFDYFQRKSKDMVGPAPELPAILGTGVPKVNNLDMTSKGWELQISWRDRIKDFSYGATLSLADSRVVIDKYPNPSKSLSQTYYEGSHLGDLWGYQTVGIAKTEAEMQNHLGTLTAGGQTAIGSNWGAGDIMYADLNGDKKIDKGSNTVADHGDLKLLGNSTPRYNFGLNLDAQWKGFDLKVFFQGVLKRDYMPGSGSTMFWGAVGYWQSNFFKPQLDYFRAADTKNPLGPNVDGYYPRPLENGRNRQAQSRYMQNAAYCRLKNLTLGYSLPKSLISKFYISNLRLFVSAENILTITSLKKTFDPETIGIGGWDGCTYPLSKTFSFGLSVTL